MMVFGCFDVFGCWVVEKSNRLFALLVVLELDPPLVGCWHDCSISGCWKEKEKGEHHNDTVLFKSS